MINIDTHTLETFLHLAQEKIDRLIQDAKLAQDSFNQCVEYFGETPRTQNPAHFFAVFVKFQRAYQVDDRRSLSRVNIVLFPFLL